jgi:hypothetical protein
MEPNDPIPPDLLKDLEELLVFHGGRDFLRGVGQVLINVGDASGGPCVGRAIKELADVEW